MIRPLTHDEVAELLGVYALDAVDADDRGRIEDHLRDCPRCRSEVAQHLDTASHLAFAGAPAPTGVWNRIAATLEGVEAEPDLARMYPLDRPARSSWAVRGLAAAAVILAVALGGLGWMLHTQQGKVNRIGADQEMAHELALASADPASTKLALTSADRRITVAVVITSDGTGYLAADSRLPALPGSETYELWGISSHRTVKLDLLGDRPSVVAFHQAVPGLVAMAVTAEQAGGVAQPTTAPVVSGQLPV